MYFPKSQITPNLHTNGNEFIYKKSQKDYIGHYYETSTGQFFTGTDPTQGSNFELIKPSSLSPNSQINDLSTDDESSSTSILHLGDTKQSDGDRVIDVSPEYMKILGPEYEKTHPSKERLLPQTISPSEIDEKGEFIYRYYCKNITLGETV
jgi:hypothetical protein